MGWEDRSYYRDRSGAMGNPILRVLNGSVPLFTAFGIRVRAHAFLIIFILGEILLGGSTQGYVLQFRLVGMGMLFLLVLLHEFGHCFAARSVGGSAEDILLWPLGGLAFPSRPHRPWAEFVTVAGGPLVNVLICVMTAVALFIVTPNHLVARLNPFNPWPFPIYGWRDPALYLWWMFYISYILLIFNLLPIYPLDGGKILQSALWPWLGHRRSMSVATLVGIVGGVILILASIVTRQLLLAFVALFVIVECRRQRIVLRETAGEPWETEQQDYSASLFHTEKPKRRRVNKRAIRRARRIAQAEAMERAHVDAILAKVSAHGMQSMTWTERRVLRKATEHQRQRDLDLKP